MSDFPKCFPLKAKGQRFDKLGIIDPRNITVIGEFVGRFGYSASVKGELLAYECDGMVYPCYRRKVDAGIVAAIGHDARYKGCTVAQFKAGVSK